MGNPIIDVLVAATQAKRAAQGLVSTYHGANGPFTMAHPSEAHKRYYDLKYSLRAKYGKTSAAPKAELAKLDKLLGALRAK